MFFNNSKFFQYEKSIESKLKNEVEIYKLKNEDLDEKSLNKWAIGLRNNYIEEELIEPLRSGTGVSKEVFLEKNILPNPNVKMGPSIMSGEFAELLVYDYVDFILDFYVSRTRYLDKINPNVSISGTDVLGYKINILNKANVDDILFIGEVKAKSDKTSKMTIKKNPISNAIKDSKKDKLRLAESLNADKR